MDLFFVISGCSGGGKSTLLTELAHRGFAAVAEPGRRVVDAEVAGGGSALPWLDMEAFLRRAIDLAISDYAAALKTNRPTFFDRSLVDAASALEALTGEAAIARYCNDHRYAHRVFMAPPWPEIFVADDARRHGLPDAIAEYDRLAMLYPSLGYDMRVLPKSCVADRADLIVKDVMQAAG